MLHQTQENACSVINNANGIFTGYTKFIEESKDLAIYGDLSISFYTKLRFTVDTGAMSSLIRRNVIKPGTIVTKDNTEFRGLVKGNHVRAIGKIETSIIIDQIELPHTFYVMRDDINLRNAGIIGADFLRKYNAQIDYSRAEMKLRFPIFGRPIIDESEYVDHEKWDNNEEMALVSDPKPIQTDKRNKKESRVQFDPVTRIYLYENETDEIVNIRPKRPTSLPNTPKRKINDPQFYKKLPEQFQEKYESLKPRPVSWDPKTFQCLNCYEKLYYEMFRLELPAKFVEELMEEIIQKDTSSQSLVVEQPTKEDDKKTYKEIYRNFSEADAQFWSNYYASDNSDPYFAKSVPTASYRSLYDSLKDLRLKYETINQIMTKVLEKMQEEQSPPTKHSKETKHSTLPQVDEASPPTSEPEFLEEEDVSYILGLDEYSPDIFANGDESLPTSEQIIETEERLN